MLKKKRGNTGKHKFCPVCGEKLEKLDGYCTHCGYSFEKRKKRKKKGIKWKNIIFIVIILIIFYISIRYFNGQSILPASVQDALNISIIKKG